MFVLNFFFNPTVRCVFKEECYPFTSFISVGGSQYWWKRSLDYMILNKMRQDRTTLLITLCKRFLYNSKSSHISFSSSSTNTLSFVSLLLCNLTGTRCVPTPLLPSSLQTFLLGSFSSTHMFPLLLSALTHFCWFTSIKFQFPFFKLFLLFSSSP